MVTGGSVIPSTQAPSQGAGQVVGQVVVGDLRPQGFTYPVGARGRRRGDHQGAVGLALQQGAEPVEDQLLIVGQ